MPHIQALVLLTIKIASCCDGRREMSDCLMLNDSDVERSWSAVAVKGNAVSGGQGENYTSSVLVPISRVSTHIALVY